MSHVKLFRVQVEEVVASSSKIVALYIAIVCLGSVGPKGHLDVLHVLSVVVAVVPAVDCAVARSSERGRLVHVEFSAGGVVDGLGACVACRVAGAGLAQR